MTATPHKSEDIQDFNLESGIRTVANSTHEHKYHKSADKQNQQSTLLLSMCPDHCSQPTLSLPTMNSFRGIRECKVALAIISTSAKQSPTLTSTSRHFLSNV